MQLESGPWLARLAICLLCLGHLAAQTAPPGPPSPVPCKTSFLRTYLLKGFTNAISTQPFFICPSITSSCCSRRDQLYIFHYLKSVLPAHLEAIKMRRDSAFQRLRNLHKRLVRTSPDYSKVGAEKGRFCMTEWRKFSTFDAKKFVDEYAVFSDGWLSLREKSLSSFYCSLCDGANQGFLDPQEPAVVLSQATCSGFVQNNQAAIRFWLGQFMDFMINFQNVVDCNHYTASYNLTFFNPHKLAERNHGLSCLRSVGANLTPSCRKFCASMGLASLTPWVDGDPAFMEEAVNFFEKSNFNQETGRFISMEMRHYFRRFQPIKQLNETAQGLFRNVVNQALTPVVQSLNAVEVGMSLLPVPPRLDFRMLRERVRSSRERRLMNKPPLSEPTWNPMGIPGVPKPVFRPSNHNSEPLKGTYVVTANAQFVKELERSPLLLNRRRLQTVPPKKINSPRTEIPYEDTMMYDQIAIEPRNPRLNFVFAAHVVPLDIDKISKVYSTDGGLRTEYMMMDLDMDPISFRQLIYIARPPDRFYAKIEVLVDSVEADIRKQSSDILDADFSVNPQNYFIATVPATPERKLHLRGANAADLLKEITAKR